MAHRIIIVAGPSCCGKTTLVRQLMRGQATAVAEHCRFYDPHSWKYGDIWLREQEILRDIRDPASQLLLHYTIPYPALKYFLRRGYDKKSRLAILSGADDVTIVTLVADSSTLLSRVNLRKQRHCERRREGIISQRDYLRGLWSLRRLRKLYADPAKLSQTYQNWSSFVARIGAHHYLLDVNHDHGRDTSSKGRPGRSTSPDSAFESVVEIFR